MGDNNIDLKSVGELIKEKKKFFIPSYQRGYRWTEQQVKDLLNDMSEFASATLSSTNTNSFYCLQPVVIKKMSNTRKGECHISETEEWYEVIDGQQRLTTIKIILSVLEAKNTFSIEYETRKNSKVFLDSIKEKSEKEAGSNIDFFHMLQAKSAIEKWLQENNDADNDNLKNAIRSLCTSPKDDKFNRYGTVQVIWYEIAEDDATNPIDTFTRLNIGKIPLTNAELIKALFLRKGNFTESAERWQIEIANEWDNMEYKLQDDAFWYFLTNGEKQKTSRIEFLFDVMCEIAKQNNDEAASDKKIGTDDYKTFRFFNNKFAQAKSKDDGKENQAEKIWGEIKEYFRTFEEWFENPILYHYIGYLICCGERITNIYKMSEKKAKDEFETALKEKIKSTLQKVNIEELNYGDKNVKNVLLLLNIQHLIEKNKSDENDKEKDKCRWYIRFPFYIYKKENWDIEHIDSYTENQLTKLGDQKEWIKIAQKDLTEIFEDEKHVELQKGIEDFLNSDKSDKFLDLKNQLSNIAGEDTDDEAPKNNIGNLTLLNADINRSYKNSLFITKRKSIIDNDKNGKFIPICTKNVFLKYFDSDGTSNAYWSYKNGDYDSYISFIKETLKDFLSNTENGEEK